MKPIRTMTKSARVGIYDGEYTARVYKDKVVVITPTVRWRGNTGTYDTIRTVIRHQPTIDAVIAAPTDDTAWDEIGLYLQDGYLAAPRFHF